MPATITAEEWIDLKSDCYTIRSTKAAICFQRYTDHGSKPTQHNTVTQWFPISVLAQDGNYWQCKAWFLRKNGLMHWAQGR